MRLDKFLQVSRLVKRRTLANRLCAAGRVTRNGIRAKPAAAVEVGDLVGIDFGERRITVKVLRIPTGRPSQEPITELVEDHRIRDFW